MSLLPLLLSAAVAQTAAGAVVRAGDVGLTAPELTARALDFLRGQGKSIPNARRFLDGVVDELLLADDAKRGATASAPMTTAAVEAQRAKALAREYWEREFLAKAKPPPEMVRDIFHDRDTVRLRLVVLSTQKEAEEARARLASGGDFALEAARSLHRSSSNKGDTGFLTRRDMDPALAGAAFAAPLSTLFGPVPLGLGFAVGQVTERRLADESALAAERPKLEAWARRQLAGQARAHFLEMSRKKRGTRLDVAFLESLGKEMSTTEAQANHVIATVDGKPVRYRAIMPEVEAWKGAGSHMFGPAVRIRVAEQHLDNLMLASAASEAGLLDVPAVAAAVRVAELSALARANASRIVAAAPPKERSRAVELRLAKLRKQLPSSIDLPAATAALEVASRASSSAP